MKRVHLCLMAAAVAFAGVSVVASQPAGARDASGRTTPPRSAPRRDRGDVLAEWAQSAEHAGRVTVEVLLDPQAPADGSMTAAIEALGGVVNGAVPGFIVQADMPVRALAALRATDGVATVRRPLPQGRAIDPAGGAARAKSIDSYSQALNGEEVQHVNAATWHAAGHRGTGVKIGIVDGFDGASWNANVASGDLPAIGADHTMCVIEGNTCDVWASQVTHGVAVAELIHELAPGAELYVASAFTAGDLQAVVDWFAANGVTIVNRSLGAPFDGPGNGTGPLNAVADSAVAAGMAWFNSAGNEAGRNGRNGTYYRAPFTDSGTGFHLFVAPPGGAPLPAGGPYDSLRMRCDGFINGSLRWNDWGDGAATDLDFYAFAADDGALLAESVEDQAAGAPPVETLGAECAPGELVDLVIEMYAPGGGTADDIVEIFAESEIELWSNPYSASYSIVDSANPGVFAIGANEGDHSIADYSSEGPMNDGREKPDFTARSNVTTNALPNFQGTSASSPIAAGMAALVLGSGLANSPAALRTWLLANATTDRGATGLDNVFGHGELVLPAPTGTPSPPPPAAPAIVPIAPARFLDTRGEPTFAGTFTAGGRALANSVLLVPMAGAGGVPEGAAGIVANLTAIGPDGPGFATLFPCSPQLPTASHVNFLAGSVVANNVVVPLDGNGDVCLYSSTGADYALDVSGYVPAGSPVALFTAQRYLDSRPGEPTFDGGNSGQGTLSGGSQFEVQVAGRGQIPAGATAAMVSVTAISPHDFGFVSLYPCSGDPAAASTLNYGPGQFVPNGAIVQLSPTGTLCVYSSAGSDIALDVAGYVPGGTASLVTRSPARLFDSRGDAVTVDGQFGAWGRIPPDHYAEIQVAGRAGVPPGATGVTVNLATIGPDGPSFLTVWPCGPFPTTSSLNNAVGGVVRANNAIVKLSPAGTLCLYSFAGTDAIVDITGWLTS